MNKYTFTLILEEPLIYQMLQFRFDSAVGLVSQIREIVKKHRPNAKLQAAFVPPSHLGHDMTSPRSWLTVQSYKKYADVLDEIFAVVHYTPQIVRFETERAVSAAEGKTKIVTGMKLYADTSPEMVPQLAEAAIAGGSEGVHFLGYDIASDELLESIRKWKETRGEV